MGLGPSDLFDGKRTEEGSTPMAMGTRNHLARLFEGESVGGMTDGQLLDRFTSRRGAESAFEALVARHGPMVARVCRSCLRDEHDVEDAFQATFLVLVRRANSIGERDLLAPWLYGVAHKVARKARAVALRRRGREGEGAGIDPPARLDGSAAVQVELGPVLHEEVDRLPEKYRRPIILCHLQGLTHAEAAQELAWPVGTVSVRLARARKILADRLTRRGITASATLVATTLATEATAALAPTWIQTAAVAALSASSGLALTATSAAVSAGAITLAQRTSMMMLLSSWKWLTIPATVALATTTGAVLVGSGGADDPQKPPAPAQTKTAPTQLDGPFANPSTIQIESGGSTIITQQRDDSGQVFIADDMVISGKLVGLAKTVEQLKTSNPNATFRLQLSGGKLQYQSSGPNPKSLTGLEKTPEIALPVLLSSESNAKIPTVKTPAPTQNAQPELAVDLTGQESRVIGQPIEYKLTVTNSGTVPANAVQITAILPREGGKLAQGPLPPGANFDPKDRRLIWRIDQLEPGQSAERKFLYETTSPGEYRCLAEVVSEPFRATKEMVTEVEKPPVVKPPLVVSPDGKVDLDPPPGYFDLPAPELGKPGSLQPVRIGQTVQVEALEALPGRRLTGRRIVRSDGTISLDFYGDLSVVGLNRDQIKVKLIERMGEFIPWDLLGLIQMRDGKIIAVPPVRSHRVYVDDQPEPSPTAPAAKEPAGKRAATAPPRPMSGPVPVKVGQTLLVEVLEALPGRPISGERVVRPDGTISLGFYGDLAVAGLTRDQIKVKVVEHLQRFIEDETLGLQVVNPRTGKVESVPPLQTDRVFVMDDLGTDWDSPTEPSADGKVQVGQLLTIEVVEALPGRPITGERIVQRDGTVNLGFYGDLGVVGLTRDQIKVKVIELLRAKVSDEKLGLTTTDAQGRKKTVAPADSVCVFVDDAVPKRGPRTNETLEGLRGQVVDLSGKLDAALDAINELRRDRNREPARAKLPRTP